MRIHAPKIEIFGQFDLLNGLQYLPKAKKPHPCVSPRIWAIKRENMGNDLTCRWVA